MQINANYLIRRLMVLPILLIGVSIIVFALTRWWVTDRDLHVTRDEPEE